MKAPLTQTLVDKLRKEGVRVEVWDAKLVNFYLQVRESGTGTFYIRYTLAPTNAKQSYRLGDRRSVVRHPSPCHSPSHAGPHFSGL